LQTALIKVRGLLLPCFGGVLRHSDNLSFIFYVCQAEGGSGSLPSPSLI